MGPQIKYRFAADAAGNLVDVNSLDRMDLDKRAKFFSIDFNQELVPALGKSRRKHFKHKPNNVVLGSKETYLHALGKKVFLEQYEFCKRTNTPFYLEYFKQNTCNRLNAEFGLQCNLREGPFKYNLISHFNAIDVEKVDGEFRPDLLLHYPERDEKIYVEIAVTHKSSNRKLQSGIRIIEYSIQREEDIDLIRKSVIGINNSYATLHNFIPKKTHGAFCEGGCKVHEFYYFFVSQNGKCMLKDSLKEIELQKISYNLRGTNLFEIYRPHHRFSFALTGRKLTHIDVYLYFMARASKADIAVKNCFLCKYHSDNNSRYYKPAVWKPIWCMKLKQSCSSNDASECEEYTISLDYVDHFLCKGRRQETRLP